METVRFWPRRLRRRASIKRDERADAGPYRDILLVTSFSIPLRTTSAKMCIRDRVGGKSIKAAAKRVELNEVEVVAHGHKACRRVET